MGLAPENVVFYQILTPGPGGILTRSYPESPQGPSGTPTVPDQAGPGKHPGQTVAPWDVGDAAVCPGQASCSPRRRKSSGT